MLVSREHKFVYIAIPKCASMSMHNTLFPLLESEIDSELKEVLHMYDGHATLKEAEAYLNLHGIDVAEYYKFAIVRNPFDRLVSYAAWNYPEEFAENPQATVAKAIEENNVFTRPQYLYVDSATAIFPYEDMENGLPLLFNEFGWTINGIRKDNESNRGPYQEYYTDALIAAVQAKYAQDLEQFNYSF